MFSAVIQRQRGSDTQENYGIYIRRPCSFLVRRQPALAMVQDVGDQPTFRPLLNCSILTNLKAVTDHKLASMVPACSRTLNNATTINVKAVFSEESSKFMRGKGPFLRIFLEFPHYAVHLKATAYCISSFLRNPKVICSSGAREKTTKAKWEA
eukprot:6201255-Pleurochrysis_carterae.AAC.5